MVIEPPRWFRRELWVENHGLFVVWDQRRKRWTIRAWAQKSPRRTASRPDWIDKSVIITTVCFRDGGGHDIGFKPLDSRALYALRRSRWLGEGVGRAQMEIDSANEKLEKEFDDLIRTASRDAVIDAFKHFDTVSVYGGVTTPIRYKKPDPVRHMEEVAESAMETVETL